MARRVHGINVGGEGRKAEIDGGYFGGYVKPAKHVENRRDRRLRQYQSGKRKDVVVIREREARHCLACSPQKSLRLISSAPGSPGALRSMLTKPGRGTSFMAGLRCTGWVQTSAPHARSWISPDSPLERDGFEPLVPLRKGTASSETTLIDLRLLLLPEDQATPSRE